MSSDINIISSELEEMDMPEELKTLLSCSLCGRDYDLLLLMPRMLECKHVFCVDCAEGRLTRAQAMDQVICPICERHTRVGQQPESLVFLLGQLPALRLGRAMLMNHASQERQRSAPPTNSGGNASAVGVNGVGSQRLGGLRERYNNPRINWIDQISVENFLRRSSCEHCPVHAMPHTIWCHNCQIMICQACAELQYHFGHRLTRQLDYGELLRQLFSNELAKIRRISDQTTQIAARELGMWHQLCETCSLVQLHIKREILEHKPTLIACQMRGWRQRTERDLLLSDAQLRTVDLQQLLGQLSEQKAKFQEQLNDLQFQCRLKALIYENGMEILDFKQLNQRVLELRQPVQPNLVVPSSVESPPALVLTNYCIYSYWKELQTHVTTYSQANQSAQHPTELFPQDRRAVVPPHFNQRQREREAMRHLMQEQQHIQRQLQQHTRFYTYWEDFNADQLSSNSGSDSPSASSSTTSSCSNPAAHLFEDNNYNCLNLDQHLPQRSGNQYDAPNSPYWALHVQQTMQESSSQHENDVSNLASAATAVGVNDQATAAAAASATAENCAVPLFHSNPTVRIFPIYFLDIEMAGNAVGRILIEVRNDVAPRMAENFGNLIEHERGFGYRGCSIFQAWPNESIITGDFEYHNGRGGYAALEEDHFFMPDNTQLPTRRGAVGMRRGHRIYDNNSFVGSQFRLILNEICPFTAIFGHIVDGLDLVDRIARTGDATGRPVIRSIIKNCGTYPPK